MVIPLPEFVERLRARYLELMQQTAEPLVNGAAPDFPTYRQHSGVILGLRMARDELNDLVKKVNDGRE